MSDTKPFLIHTSVDRTNYTAESVWLLARHKIRVNTSRWHRFGEKPDDVRLSEVLAVSGFFQDHQWEQANVAANRVYKLMTRLGQDTTGHAGF